tara:strand:- start:1361 stop:1741 length:381 start_codon:yes stop_codon:yes gene_type:complete
MENKLAQANYPINMKIISLLLPKGVTCTFPQTTDDLVALGKQHKHALQSPCFTELCKKGDYLIFTLSASHDKSDFYTFEFNTQTNSSEFGFMRHAVGMRNKPAPQWLRNHAKRVAHEVFLEIFKHK